MKADCWMYNNCLNTYKKVFILSSAVAWISACEIGENMINIVGAVKDQGSPVQSMHKLSLRN